MQSLNSWNDYEIIGTFRVDVHEIIICYVSNRNFVYPAEAEDGIGNETSKFYSGVRDI